ncbi:unnamed protein product [Pleuronectes platessa]|uniref:Uncharacterized protein n=1 Tax=Pleuronectes platessa TaxID=8262 RepID=A0A9N7YFP4_PLEPL|nr:unnamed protein product [Pleuronectes platessa]
MHAPHTGGHMVHLAPEEKTQRLLLHVREKGCRRGEKKKNRMQCSLHACKGCSATSTQPTLILRAETFRLDGSAMAAWRLHVSDEDGCSAGGQRQQQQPWEEEEEEEGRRGRRGGVMVGCWSSLPESRDGGWRRRRIRRRGGGGGGGKKGVNGTSPWTAAVQERRERSGGGREGKQEVEEEEEGKSSPDVCHHPPIPPSFSPVLHLLCLISPSLRRRLQTRLSQQQRQRQQQQQQRPAKVKGMMGEEGHGAAAQSAEKSTGMDYSCASSDDTVWDAVVILWSAAPRQEGTEHLSWCPW